MLNKIHYNIPFLTGKNYVKKEIKDAKKKKMKQRLQCANLSLVQARCRHSKLKI